VPGEGEVAGLGEGFLVLGVGRVDVGETWLVGNYTVVGFHGSRSYDILLPSRCYRLHRTGIMVWYPGLGHGRSVLVL